MKEKYTTPLLIGMFGIMAVTMIYTIGYTNNNLCYGATESADYWGKINLEESQYINNKLDYYIDSLDKLDFYYNDQKFSIKHQANGFYSQDGYYCVWTKYRTPDETWKTDCHERLHALLYQNNDSYEHFCLGEI